MKEITLIISILFLISCKKDTVEPIAPKLDVKGKVKTIVEYGYSAVEKWGEITEGMTTSKESHTYNESGFETEGELYLTNGNLECKWVQNYDSSNKILASYTEDAYGTIYDSTKFQYDSKGKLINWKLYYNGNLEADVNCVTDANGRVIKESTSIWIKDFNYAYKYDARGNKIEENSLNESNVTYYTKKYEYDSTDKLIKESGYFGEGMTLRHVISYTYDLKGNITDIIDAYTGSVPKVTKYIYDEFDTLDNWTKRRNYKDNKITGINKRVITYY